MKECLFEEFQSVFTLLGFVPKILITQSLFKLMVDWKNGFLLCLKYSSWRKPFLYVSILRYLELVSVRRIKFLIHNNTHYFKVSNDSIYSYSKWPNCLSYKKKHLCALHEQLTEQMAVCILVECEFTQGLLTGLQTSQKGVCVSG